MKHLRQVDRSNLPGYIQPSQEVSPIDEFRASLLAHLSVGSASSLLESDLLGRLLLVGIVSAAENYVRSIISGAVNICPVAQTCSSDRPVTLGAVTWHIGSRYSRPGLEHSSLAEAKGLRAAFRDFVGVPLPDGEFLAPLNEYEKTCQLRHGVVHNDGFVPGRNAIKLEIPRMVTAARIVVRYEQLQEVGAVVSGLVRLLNRHIFLVLCRRWATDWRRRSDWVVEDEESAFSKVWDLCLSRSERQLRSGRSKLTRKACIDQVRSDFGLA